MIRDQGNPSENMKKRERKTGGKVYKIFLIFALIWHTIHTLRCSKVSCLGHIGFDFAISLHRPSQKSTFYSAKCIINAYRSQNRFN